MFNRLRGWYTIYTFSGTLPPKTAFLSGAKFTLRPSLTFSYIGGVTVRHSSSRRQPNCGAVSSCDRAAIPFDIGWSNCLVYVIFIENVYICEVQNFGEEEWNHFWFAIHDWSSFCIFTFLDKVQRCVDKFTHTRVIIDNIVQQLRGSKQDNQLSWANVCRDSGAVRSRVLYMTLRSRRCVVPDTKIDDHAHYRLCLTDLYDCTDATSPICSFCARFSCTLNILLSHWITAVLSNYSVIYTVSQNKTRHYNIVHNFAKCWPIFNFFSLTDSLVNMQQNRH